MKSEFENDDGILLCVYVLAPNVYDELIAENEKLVGISKIPEFLYPIWLQNWFIKYFIFIQNYKFKLQKF